MVSPGTFISRSASGPDVMGTRSLKIEVKASIRRFKNACLNITPHEWRTAQTNLEEYVFHFWLLDLPETPPNLYVIQSGEILKHLPENQGKGAWTNASIPIGALSHPSKAIIQDTDR